MSQISSRVARFDACHLQVPRNRLLTIKALTIEEETSWAVLMLQKDIIEVSNLAGTLLLIL